MVKIKKIVNNNFFMLGLLMEYAPKYVIFSFVINLSKIYDTLVSVFLIRYLVNAVMYHNETIVQILGKLLILCLITIGITALESYYNNLFLPTDRLPFDKNFTNNYFERYRNGSMHSMTDQIIMTSTASSSATLKTGFFRYMILSGIFVLKSYRCSSSYGVCSISLKSH